MRQELNSPREMAERAAYACHVLLFLGGIFLAVSTVANAQLAHGLLSALSLISGYLLRVVGMYRLDFEKHERGIATNVQTNRAGDFEDEVHQLYLLFERLENQPMMAMERQRLRRRIVAMLREDERLARYYYHRLRERHPYMLNAF